MGELQKNKKASRGIVSRRKPKRNKDTTKCPLKKESDWRKFNLVVSKELFALVVDAASSRNQKINAFISDALRAALDLPAAPPPPPPAPKLNNIKLFIESMSTFDWTQALNKEEQEKKSHGNKETD